MDYTVSTIDKIDEKFDFSQIANYIKSIQFSLNGFSYIVTDPSEPLHLALRSYNFGTEVSLRKLEEIITDLFQNEDILSTPSAKTIVTYMDRPWSMTPQMLFDKTKAEVLLDVNFKKDEFAHLVNSVIPTTDIVFTSRIPDKLVSILQQHNQNLTILPHQCALARNAFFNLTHHNLSDAFFLNLNHNFFDLLIIKNHKIHFYNNFPYQQYADVLYYTLASIEKTQSDTQNMHFFIQGIELVKDVLVQEFSRFIKNVFLDRVIYGATYSHHFDQLPLYEYKLLTGLYPCVS